MSEQTVEAVALQAAHETCENWDVRPAGMELSMCKQAALTAIAAHTKALVDGAGEICERLNDHAHMIQRDGLGPMPDTAAQAAAAIAALQAQLATARIEGVRAGIEASAGELREELYAEAHDTDFDTGFNHAKRLAVSLVLHLDAAAIVEGMAGA